MKKVYYVRFYRTGGYCKRNRNHKGVFTRKFNSLSELALFLFRKHKIFPVDNVLEFLSKEEFIILCSKLDALERKYPNGYKTT